MFTLTSTEKLIISTLQQEGMVYLVGGCIRDVLRGQVPKDHDIATSLDPTFVENLLTPILTLVPDQRAKEHGILRGVDRITGKIVDVASLREDTFCDGRFAQVSFTKDLYKDLARRDFTINAMAAHIELDQDTQNIKLITPIEHSREDLAEHVVRFVGDPHQRIQEDYLRMLRACRFTALGTDWHLEPKTLEAIKQNAQFLEYVSKERIRDEVLKSLAYPAPANFWRSVLECNLLPLVFPELTKAVGCVQNKHHSMDPVWDHILRCLEASVEIDVQCRPLFRLAVLLHDIGKPASKTGSGEDVHFYEHEVIGVPIASQWMTSLHFSKNDILYVTKLIRYHQFQFDDTTKLSSLRRWLRDVGKEIWEDLIMLRCCDRKGNLAKQHLPVMTREIRSLWEKISNIIANNDPIFIEDLAINGHDIIASGVEPGPRIRQIQKEILGIVWTEPKKNTREFLLSYVEKHHGKRN
jgi:putative nucleotidyltransferase with HDIG domain